MLKGNETLSSLTWEMLARKNIKKHKRLVLRLEALYLVKNIFCLCFSPVPKLWSRKKVIFKVFWRYSKTLSKNLFCKPLKNILYLMYLQFWFYLDICKTKISLSSSPYCDGNSYADKLKNPNLALTKRCAGDEVGKIRTCENISRSWKISMLETGLKRPRFI